MNTRKYPRGNRKSNRERSMKAPRNEREAHEAYLETKRNHHEGCTI